MNCQRCGENPGEIPYTEYVDGEVRKSTICAGCAEELGFGPTEPRAPRAGPEPAPQAESPPEPGAVVFSAAGLSIDPPGAALRCPGCGLRGAELRNATLLGCAECYGTYGRHLDPVLERLHGATEHRGRLPEPSRDAEPLPASAGESTLLDLAGEAVPWLGADGPRADLVLSSRVRLARNLGGHPFPHRALASDAEAVLEDVVAVFGSVWNLETLSRWERQILLERHLASPRLVGGVGPRGVALAPDRTGHVMINEEDHLRIQSVASGFQLSTALTGALDTDRRLETRLDFAASERHGYLTACPTNVGTGLRASVLLHLPGLVLLGELKRLHAAVSEMGMVARGWFGEGSRVVGDFHQLSNQRTLGLSEEDTVAELERVAERVLELELEARERLAGDPARRRQLEDRVHRSRATLAHARLLTVEQAMACVSDVRLGKWLGRFEDVSDAALNRLTVFAQPAHLARETERMPSTEEACWQRARLARNWFGPEEPAGEDEGGPES